MGRLFAADLYFACALGAGDPRALAVAETELFPAARQAVALQHLVALGRADLCLQRPPVDALTSRT